jgi:hypothetical protein
MPSREPTALVDVEAIRAAAAARAAATSISQVARDVGLTTRGMNLFLKGSEPYSATRQKLERWYVRWMAEQADATDAVTAAAAISVLTHDIPPAQHRQVAADAVRWWGTTYDELGLPRPRWIEQLEARVSAPAETDGYPPPRRRRRRT